MGRGRAPRAGGFPSYLHENNLNNQQQRNSYDLVSGLWPSQTDAGERPPSSGSNDWTYTSYPNQTTHTRNGTNGSSPRTSIAANLAFQIGGMGSSSMRRPSHDNGFIGMENTGERLGAGPFNIATSGPSEQPAVRQGFGSISYSTQPSHRSSVVADPSNSFSSLNWQNTNNNRGSVGDVGAQANGVASWLASNPAEVQGTTERPIFRTNWSNSAQSMTASARPFSPASPTAWENGSVNGFQNSNGFQAGNGLQIGNGFVNGNGLQNGNGYQTTNGFQGGNGFQTSNGFQAGNGFQIGNGFQTGFNANGLGNYTASQQSRSSLSQAPSRPNYSTSTNFDRRASTQSFIQQSQPTPNLALDTATLQQQLQMYNLAQNLGMANQYSNPSLQPSGVGMGSMASSTAQSGKLREYSNNTRNAAQKWDLKVRISWQILLSLPKLTLKQQIYGSVADFAADRAGSRFIQDKLQSASSEEKAEVYRELMEELIPLMTDVYGNYVVQKFFEHGTQEQKTNMALVIKNNMLRLSENKYGCRVVQKVGSSFPPMRHTQLSWS